MEPDQETDGEQQKKKTPAQLFAEKVSVAGLEEAYGSEEKYDKILFRLALLVAFAMIVFQAYTIAWRYKDVSTVYNDNEMIHEPTPFPKVTVCYSGSLNEEQFWSKITIPENVARMMLEHNVTKTDITNYLRAVYAMTLSRSSAATPLHRIAAKLYAHVVEEHAAAGASKEHKMSDLNDCTQIVSNCAFDGHAFDCNELVESMTILMEMCCQLNMDLLRNVTDSSLSDTMRLQGSGLVFDVSKDWTHGLYQDGSASDGYHVFVDVHPSPNEDPVSIPGGMDALITLAQPKKVEELTQCFPEEKVSVLTFFKQYDAHGIQCQAEIMNRLSYENLGCMTPMLSYVPNQTCSMDQAFLLSLLTSGAQVEDFSFGFGDRIKARMDRAFTTMKRVINKRACQPLCTRWTYRILSASYGSIQYANEIEQLHRTSNRSWSRIRVLMPIRAPWRHVEQHVAVGYVTLCEIGGMMGVYAGFSMITFAEILAYGLVVCWSYVRKRRVVAPAIEDQPPPVAQPPSECPSANPCAVTTIEVKPLHRSEWAVTDRHERMSRFSKLPSTSTDRLHC